MKYDWKMLLNQYNQLFLEKYGKEMSDEVTNSYIKTGKLLFSPATDEEILLAEKRLSIQFPLSYREFLKVSNGFGPIDSFIWRLWSTNEVEWLHTRHQSKIDIWNDQNYYDPVPDDEYFVYGEEQYTENLRVEYLRSALEISDIGDSAILLLNPEIVTPDGEWEAWYFANWYPGAARYRSFWDLMQDVLNDHLENS